MGCNKSSKSLKMIMLCYAKFLAVAMWVHSVAEVNLGMAGVLE